MKHAFLLMAHTNYPLIGRIVRKLDHPDNTIFIHIDKKSAFTEADAAAIRSCCEYSVVHFVERFVLTWGGYSQVHGGLRLLETAVKERFDYYHFLSGADFPIKPMKEIHKFFEEHNGCEFVHFCEDAFTKKQYGRFAQYHYLQEKCGRDKRSIIFWIEKASCLIQNKVLHVDRTRKYADMVYKSGGSWCSLTHAFSEYLLSKEQLIQDIFSYTVCADEHYIQTILFNSPYFDNLYGKKYGVTGYDACLRSIEWGRTPSGSSSPHTFTIEDYEDLISSPNLFCRKIEDTTPAGDALIKKLEQL